MGSQNGFICVSKAMAINKIYDFSIYKKSKGFRSNHFKERFIKFTNFDREDFILIPNLNYDFEVEVIQHTSIKNYLGIIKNLLELDPLKRAIN